jgi:hypothetical protein
VTLWQPGGAPFFFPVHITGLFSDELNKMLLHEFKKHSHVYAGILLNLEGRILENSPLDFDVAGSVFKNRKQIEIDFLLANQKQNPCL